MLKVKKLIEHAILPTVAYPGFDLGYDIYAAERAWIKPGQMVLIGTGIAAQFERPFKRYGLLIRDRGSISGKGLMVSAGVVDASYTGEIKVRLTHTQVTTEYGRFLVDENDDISDVIKIEVGDKIAQMIPIEVMTQFPVVEVQDLDGDRGTNGFGSSGS